MSKTTRPLIAVIAALALLGCPKIARADEPQHTKVLGTSAPATESGASDPKLLGGIVALSAGGALLVVGGYSYIKAHNQNNDDAWQSYLQTVPASEDPCDYARSKGDQEMVDHCDSNKRWKTIAFVTLPLGLAAATTGIVLLATRDSKFRAEKRSAFSVTPAAGPRGGGIALGYRF